MTLYFTTTPADADVLAAAPDAVTLQSGPFRSMLAAVDALAVGESVSRLRVPA